MYLVTSGRACSGHFHNGDKMFDKIWAYTIPVACEFRHPLGRRRVKWAMNCVLILFVFPITIAQAVDRHNNYVRRSGRTPPGLMRLIAGVLSSPVMVAAVLIRLAFGVRK